MANEYAGFQEYLFVADESVWGVTPGSPTYRYVPYTQYNVAAIGQAVQPELYTGLYQERASQIVKTLVQGSINLPAFGYQLAGVSHMQRFMDYALNRTTPIFLPSFLAEINESGTDNKRHNGLRIGQLTLAGDADGGTITQQMQAMGYQETGGITVQTVPVTAPQPIEARFTDATLTIASTPVGMRSFSVTIQNNLQVKHQQGQWPYILHAGVRRITFQFELFKNANTYDLLNRSLGSNNYAITLLIKAPHSGTGVVSGSTFTTMQIDFPRASFTQAVKNIPNRNDLARQSPQYIALKPDSASNEINLTYGEA